MKKFLSILFTAFMALSLTACGGAAGQSADTQQNAQSKQAQPQTEGKKVMVAYFSHTGNTEKVAQVIQSKTGGDLFKIETATPYSNVYREVTEVAKQEKPITHARR